MTGPMQRLLVKLNKTVVCGHGAILSVSSILKTHSVGGEDLDRRLGKGEPGSLGSDLSPW